jgi:hypothetical protein
MVTLPTTLHKRARLLLDGSFSEAALPNIFHSYTVSEVRSGVQGKHRTYLLIHVVVVHHRCAMVSQFNPNVLPSLPRTSTASNGRWGARVADVLSFISVQLARLDIGGRRLDGHALLAIQA